MTVKLSALEADLLVRACVRTPTCQSPRLVATGLQAAEKAACNRLVKKGLMTNVMDAFYEANDAGLERATHIY